MNIIKSCWSCLKTLTPSLIPTSDDSSISTDNVYHFPEQCSLIDNFEACRSVKARKKQLKTSLSFNSNTQTFFFFTKYFAWWLSVLSWCLMLVRLHGIFYAALRVTYLIFHANVISYNGCLLH